LNRKIVVVLILTLLLTCMLTFTLSNKPTDALSPTPGFQSASGPYKIMSDTTDWWPMFHHDLTHTGYSTSTAPRTNQTLWIYKTGGHVTSSPAVVNGVVYAGSFDGKIYALDALTGKYGWGYIPTVNGEVDTSLAIANGIVYSGSSGGRVYALDAGTGKYIWSYLTGAQVWTSAPAVAYGMVYVGSYDACVYALNATNGNFIWSYTTGARIPSSPAVADGIVFIGSNDGNVYALNATNGHMIWKYLAGIVVNSSPTVANGIVYIGSNDYNVYALNATTGNKIWSYLTGNWVDSSPAVADGCVFVGSEDRNVYCLNATTGAWIWSYTTGVYIRNSSPAVADGIVFVGSYDHKIYALNETTGNFIWSYLTGDALFSSPAVANGIVYIGGYDGNIYAFGNRGVYYSVEPVAIPALTDIDPTTNTLETPHTPSPKGQNFTVEIHLRDATVANCPSGVDGVEVHFYFGNVLSYAVPTGFVDMLGQTGGALNGPSLLYGINPGFYDASGNLITGPPYTNAVYYEVAAASIGANPWNGIDGLVAKINFTITVQPWIMFLQPNVKLALVNDFTDLCYYNPYGVGIPINHGNIPGRLIIDTNAPIVWPPPYIKPIPINVTNANPSLPPIGGAPIHNSQTMSSDDESTLTFNVTAFANTTAIDSQNVTLTGGNSTTVVLYWNSTGFAYGNYSVTTSIFAYPVSNETIPENSTDVYAWVTLTIPGDINGDLKVNLVDLVLLANAYGSKPGDAKWNPNADINFNYAVDLQDLVLMALHYGQHYP